MDIGPRLKIAREAIGYTLKKASEESQIGDSSISEFENSKREPKFSQLSKLAEVYKRAIEFFLTDESLIENVMLWREKPSLTGEKERIEAEFRQLCQQYHNLELLLDEVKNCRFPELDVTTADEVTYKRAILLAEKAQREFLLGDIPSTSLKQTLEEKFYVKIFHLDFSGSAISTKSEEFGPAILLNKNSKLWRRNYDLAHELFHLLTWNIFRKEDLPQNGPSEIEEKLANTFASRLLLPTDSVKHKIEAVAGQDGSVGVEALDEIAREFGVSLEALLWRMVYLYNNVAAENIEKYVEQVKNLTVLRPPRRSDEPDKLSERYCSLAIRALREGKLSLMQFRKYMGISYREAEEYLTDEKDFTDEKISISLA